MSSMTGMVNWVRHVATGRSYERYFSANTWDNSWTHGYDLDTSKEDARYGALIALMQRYEDGGMLLDVGCGDGLLEQRYRKVSAAPMTAFDYSAAAIELAKARNLAGVEFLCADSRTFRPAEQFSIIVLNESLYYLEDHLGVMENLALSLTPSGVFIVSMYDTLITKRIWKSVERSYQLIHGVTVKDEDTGCLWRIRSLRPREGNRA